EGRADDLGDGAVVAAFGCHRCASCRKAPASGQGVGPAHDVQELHGDLGLPRAVVLPGERLDHVARGVGRRLHGDHERHLLGAAGSVKAWKSRTGTTAGSSSSSSSLGEGENSYSIALPAGVFSSPSSFLIAPTRGRSCTTSGRCWPAERKRM